MIPDLGENELWDKSRFRCGKRHGGNLMVPRVPEIGYKSPKAGSILCTLGSYQPPLVAATLIFSKATWNTGWAS